MRAAAMAKLLWLIWVTALSPSGRGLVGFGGGGGSGFRPIRWRPQALGRALDPSAALLLERTAAIWTQMIFHPHFRMLKEDSAGNA